MAVSVAAFGQVPVGVKLQFPLAFAVVVPKQRPVVINAFHRGARLSGTIQCGLCVIGDTAVGDSAGINTHIIYWVVIGTSGFLRVSGAVNPAAMPVLPASRVNASSG